MTLPGSSLCISEATERDGEKRNPLQNETALRWQIGLMKTQVALHQDHGPPFRGPCRGKEGGSGHTAHLTVVWLQFIGGD